MATSAGILPYRTSEGQLEVLIAHPGGPFWANKEEGAWSIVKGEYQGVETPEAAARREFTEETGWEVPAGRLIGLGEVVQRGGKRVLGYAVEADFDPDQLEPGTFQVRWRGRMHEFPEIDRVRWCRIDEARRLLNPAQTEFLDRLVERLDESGPSGPE